jgi:hypothetical protein
MNFEARLERLERADGQKCWRCGWETLPPGQPPVVVIAGMPVPEPCSQCGRPAVLIIEEVIVNTREEAEAFLARNGPMVDGPLVEPRETAL